MTDPECHICGLATRPEEICALCPLLTCNDCLVRDANGDMVCPGCVWINHEKEETS